MHVTWHTRLRQRLISRADAEVVRAAVHQVATRCQVHVQGLAILSDHVHVIASFRPEGGVVSFIRHAKSESARRINQARGPVFQWARGYFVTTVGRDEETIRVYIRNQEIADQQLDQLELKISAAQNPINRPKIP